MSRQVGDVVRSLQTPTTANNSHDLSALYTFRTHRPTVSGVVQVGQGHSSTGILPDLPNIGAFSVIDVTIYDQCRPSQLTVITSHNSATRRKKTVYPAAGRIVT